MLLILLLIGGMVVRWFLPRTTKWEIETGEKPVTNPLKGWACWGENFKEEYDYSLAYVPVYWDELEPEEGEYDFVALEERCHFLKWRNKRARLILRLVTDDPTEEKKMEIPQWLYDAMEGDGTWYENDYGKGFSPDYENKVFKEAHEKLLKAMGVRYGHNPQIAYIQIGSLGHWGEWHVNEKSGIDRFPDSTVTDAYVRDYLNAFPEKKLLMRRPFDIVTREGLGLYDDTFGEPEEHREWMDWIENGYISSQNGQELSGAPGFWEKAPSGGEIASYRDISWYFEDSFENTLDFIRESHTTYLGPKIPREKELSAQGWENARRCEQEMGYCFTITDAALKRQRGKDMALTVNWENIGVAPFYEDWDIRVILKNDQGATLWSGDFPTEISKWGQEAIFSQQLPGTAGLSSGKISVWVGIVDPLTGECGVKLAVRLAETCGMYCLGEAGD